MKLEISNIKKISCLGAGHMGQQIALQCAVNGFDVCLYSRKSETLENAKSAIRSFCSRLVHLKVIKENEINSVIQRIEFTNSLEQAALGAHIVIECVVENLEIKRSLFSKLEYMCSDNTVFCTNSSAIIPSKIASALKAPEKLIAVHFHTYVWEMSLVDIMPHATTDPEVVKLIKTFAVKIKQIPIMMKKESPGYIYTALLSSLNNAALKLARENVASVSEIDKSWRAAMKMPIGPFGVMDFIGLKTLRDVCQYWGEEENDDDALKNAQYLDEYVSRGDIGVQSGKGFYNYSKVNKT